MTSYLLANEAKGKEESHERLEFLGDSVLGFVVADYICLKITRNFPRGISPKTALPWCAKRHAAAFAKQIDLGNFLRLSHGEQNSGGRTRSSILADAFEAVIAAIYLDAGMEEARKLYPSLCPAHAEGTQAKGRFKDYKTARREIIQQNPGGAFGVCAYGREWAGPR